MRNQKSRAQECKVVDHIDLIPGMPDDVAVDCLARVPHRSFRSVRGVCRGWRGAAVAPEFALARAGAGASEDLVYLLQFGIQADGSPGDGDAPASAQAYGVSVYNVTTGEWRRERAAPPLPMFAQCAAVGGRLAVMGGWDTKTFEPVADVHVLDAATGVWRRGAPMRCARSFFACAEAGGKIYVAGGHDKLKNALKTAETYDAGAGADAWDPLPDMSEERDECDGMATVAGDRFLAVSGYRTGRQGGFERDAEWFDPAARVWRRLERVRAPPSAAHVVVRGRVWCIEGNAMIEYRGERREWREVGPSPPGLKAGTARAVSVGGGERVVVTGAIGSGGHALWVYDVKTKNWTVVRPPPEFAGFVFSVGSVRV